MEQQYTLSILKPDVLARNITGKINAKIESSGLKIVAQKMKILTESEAELFYAEHKERPFFGSLVQTMTSGPVVLQVLKGNDAIALYRKIMGATNPANAEAGTIRAEFAVDIEKNSVHGSDSVESAAREISIFFSKSEIVE
jgi:nucleoside-diphosphate kinase